MNLKKLKRLGIFMNYSEYNYMYNGLNEADSYKFNLNYVQANCSRTKR